ncbi:MAG: hypothetical protein U0167_13305 [bacterium]
MRRFGLALLLVLTTWSRGAGASDAPAASTPATPAAPPPATEAPPGATVLPTGLLSPDVEQKISAGFLDTMALVYQGRIVEASARVKELLALAPEDPRPYLLQARVLREYVSEQDNTRENVKPQIAPILGVLDTAKKKSEAILEKDPESVAGHLYRGWANMFRGQLHELAFEHWSAGRAAKAGKSDLDQVLARDPHNPDALMITGTYLYFADLLPGVLKLASFLLRVPGGDREQGLEDLKLAEAVPSYSQYDARGMRGAILFGFEGRLEDARDLFDAFDRQFPDNPRLVEPLAMIDLWFANRIGSGLARVERVVQANEHGPDPLSRELAARLRLYQACMQILSGRVEEGRESLALLHRDNPGRPDWFRPVVDLYLCDTDLLLGEREKAAAVLKDAAKDSDLEKLLAYAQTDGAVASAEDVDTLRRLQPVARAIYEGRLDEAESSLRDFPPASPFVVFYQAEILQLRGRSREALPHYERLLAPAVPSRCRLFVRIARLRAAEIHASLGEWEAAAAAFEDEIEKYDVKDMLRHVVRARQRYFYREADAVRG